MNKQIYDIYKDQYKEYMYAYSKAHANLRAEAAKAMGGHIDYINTLSPSSEDTKETVRVLNARIKTLEAENQHYRSILSD